MAGFTYERGSVVTFTAHTGAGVLLNVPGVGKAPVIGWVAVVVKRDMWVITTELRPVVVVNGDITVLDVESLSVDFDATETKVT